MSGNNRWAFELDRVTFSYGQTPAVSDLSLGIASGESLALLGANGSGKSTLLKILGGLVFPRAGRYRAFGRDIDERSLTREPFGVYFRASVGFVFQNADAQLFNATVAEEIAFGPRQLSDDDHEISHRVDAIMERFRISHLADRSPFALSGGEKRKVALASILIMEPELILLDEPTAGLDPRSATVLMDVLMEHKRLGRTIVTATHDLHFVPDLATRVVVMGEDRRLMADGNVPAILGDHALLRAANLVHAHRHGDDHGGAWHPHEHP